MVGGLGRMCVPERQAGKPASLRLVNLANGLDLRILRVQILRYRRLASVLAHGQDLDQAAMTSVYNRLLEVLPSCSRVTHVCIRRGSR